MSVFREQIGAFARAPGYAGRMTIDIRRAKPSDAAIVAELNADVQALHVAAVPWFFKEGGMKLEAVERLLEAPDNLVLLAEADAAPVGYLFAEHRRIPETPLIYPYEILHVHHISVRESHRRAGVGRALMDALRTAGKERDVERISADVWSFNDRAKRFFDSHGLSPYMMRLWT